MEPGRIRPPHIFISAGEASGDLHGAALARALVRRDPHVRLTCLGGQMLRGAGAEVLVDNREIAVVGLFEVFRHLKAIYEAVLTFRRFFDRERPDLVILIDFPDFNSILARFAHQFGLRILYYISPQVWAWRPGRVRTIRRLADGIAVILPFEQEFYRQHGMDVQFVGHPLLDILDERIQEEMPKYRKGQQGPLVGLLPGSRGSEIRQLLPILAKTTSRIRNEIPGISFILPVAPSVEAAGIEKELAGLTGPVQVVSGDTYNVIRSCDLLLAASGTVTLEAAIIGTPMLIIYRVSDLSYYAGRHLIKVNHVGLPNLIAGRPIIPELLQHDANPERIAAEALAFLKDPSKLDAQRKELAHIRGLLGKPGVADRVAGLAMEMIHR